jgi:hypothetical protein
MGNHQLTAPHIKLGRAKQRIRVMLKRSRQTKGAKHSSMQQFTDLSSSGRQISLDENDHKQHHLHYHQYARSGLRTQPEINTPVQRGDVLGTTLSMRAVTGGCYTLASGTLTHPILHVNTHAIPNETSHKQLHGQVFMMQTPLMHNSEHLRSKGGVHTSPVVQPGGRL